MSTALVSLADARDTLLQIRSHTITSASSQQPQQRRESEVFAYENAVKLIADLDTDSVVATSWVMLSSCVELMSELLTLETIK